MDVIQAPNGTSVGNSQDFFSISDNTLTFIIGFSILILFVILGIMASAFLCFTLKKDPYLWDAERERQEQTNALAEDADKERDKLAMLEESEKHLNNTQKTTQI